MPGQYCANPVIPPIVSIFHKLAAVLKMIFDQIRLDMVPEFLSGYHQDYFINNQKGGSARGRKLPYFILEHRGYESNIRGYELYIIT